MRKPCRSVQRTSACSSLGGILVSPAILLLDFGSFHIPCPPGRDRRAFRPVSALRLAVLNPGPFSEWNILHPLMCTSSPYKDGWVWKAQHQCSSTHTTVGAHTSSQTKACRTTRSKEHNFINYYTRPLDSCIKSLVCTTTSSLVTKNDATICIQDPRGSSATAATIAWSTGAILDNLLLLLHLSRQQVL